MSEDHEVEDDRGVEEDHEVEEDRRLLTQGARYGARIRGTSAQKLRERVMEKELAALSHTFERLRTDDAILRAATAIVSSRRRYVAGVGKSSAFASLLAGDLAAGLANVFQIDGQGLHAIDVLTDVRPQDVLVCFSVRRYRVETVELGRAFLGSGGSLVVVTDSPDAPLALDGAIVITVDTGSGSYADSPTSVAAVCQLLSSLTVASAKGARRRLLVRDALGDTLHQYLPGGTDAVADTDPGRVPSTDEGDSRAH